jgi:hypothetical protein
MSHFIVVCPVMLQLLGASKRIAVLLKMLGASKRIVYHAFYSI